MENGARSVTITSMMMMQAWYAIIWASAVQARNERISALVRAAYLDDLKCGDAASLVECLANHQLKWGEHNCDHVEDVGVSCKGRAAPSPAVTAVAAIPSAATQSAAVSAVSAARPTAAAAAAAARDGTSTCC